MKNLLKALGFEANTELQKIAKGGSARAFFRFSDSKFGACIFCEYSDEKEENFLYADIANFLAKNSVNVPQIYYHSAPKRILIMQDLGVCDLLDFSKKSEAQDTENFYKKALLELAKIHTKASADFFKNPIKLMGKFDDALYAWEQNYFYENLVQGYLKLDLKKPKAEWQNLSQKLQSLPESLLHRDFQSQNIIVQNGSVGLIDFQGLRLGNFCYDLASLLYDAYADISPALRAKLYNYYCEIRGLNAADNAQIFFCAASERLMQALGAFAFLSQKKGKKEYLKYIPTALKFLKECSANAKLDETYKIVLDCQKSLETSPKICEP